MALKSGNIMLRCVLDSEIALGRNADKKCELMRILLAEDHEANRMLVRSLLEREGHSLDFAENGLVALMRCEDHKYDLILMDILMPVMDGVRALRKLRRSDNKNSQTPVFALTAYSSESDKRRYRQVGFDLVMTKPLRPDDLKQAWSGYLKGDLSISPSAPEKPLRSFETIPFIEDEIITQLLLSGRPDEVQTIVDNYWVSAREYISTIKENLAQAMRGENEALSTVRSVAHGIKGSAATIGLLRMSRIAASLQNAPPDKIGQLVLSLSETIEPSAKLLNHRLNRRNQASNSDSAEAHSVDANARTVPNQTPSSLLGLQSPRKISTATAPRRRAQVP